MFACEECGAEAFDLVEGRPLCAQHVGVVAEAEDLAAEEGSEKRGIWGFLDRFR